MRNMNMMGIIILKRLKRKAKDMLQKKECYCGMKMAISFGPPTNLHL